MFLMALFNLWQPQAGFEQVQEACRKLDEGFSICPKVYYGGG